MLNYSLLRSKTMNKTTATTIDHNFSPKNTPDNKRGIPNDLSEILPGESFRNYFDRLCEEYYQKNPHYFDRLVTTQDTPIKCPNQVEDEAFNQLQSILEMTEELKATKISLETSFTYSCSYTQQTRANKTSFFEKRETKRSNDLIERFLTSVELNNIQAIKLFSDRDYEHKLFEDNCTQALEISLYNYCSDTKFEAMVIFLMDTIITKELTSTIPKTILKAYQDVLETLGYKVNI